MVLLQPIYKKNEQKKNEVRTSYKFQLAVTAMFIVLTFIFISPLDLFSSYRLFGLTFTTILWLAFGGFIYFLSILYLDESISTFMSIIGGPVLLILLLMKLQSPLGDWDLRNICYFSLSVFSVINFFRNKSKYSVIYTDTYIEAFEATHPDYLDFSEGLRHWIESIHPFENDVHQNALQAFFNRKEEQDEFDEELVSDESLRLWKSLNEQHAYYDGLQEKLEARFHEELKDLPNGSELLIKQAEQYETLYYERFLAMPVTKLFSGEPPFNEEEKIHFLNYMDELHISEFEESEQTLNFWYSQIHHNLYPANRFFENLFVDKFVKNRFNATDRGIRGEQKLMEELALFDERFYILENINIKEDGVNAESDALVISRSGVFTIEAKNFAEEGHYSIHISKDGRWLQKDRQGNYTPMSDVIRQSNRHILVKQKMLNREMGDLGLIEQDEYIDIHGVIAVTNDVVDINNESDYPIVRLSSLYGHIRNNELKYTEEQVQAMVELFQTNNQPDVKFPIRDIEKEFDIQMAFLKERLKEYDQFRNHLKLNN